ncbi:AAA family ATPase [Chelatococcus reniformis]|uniref:AAA+ ATPase domain-containing protein n=1 Tax=Chelatococcus reniformis TaxID=1494448 RepID=A0A916UWE9_9HYPH|nr:AAA family ATPase [Chelatococcus reniformis]GGC90519.1 hypothetical protein GCM10010994_55430 [Chelatococcus reniformis]
MNAHTRVIQAFEDFEAETLRMMQPPFRSTFGARTWSDAFKEAQPYQWLVKGIIPKREAILVYGAPQTGKSYGVQTLSLCIARGIPFHGHKVAQAGVVYCAFEGGKGFMARQRAYALHHQLGADEPIDMVVLTRRADLFTTDEDTELLIKEIEHWASTFCHPLGLVVLDTFSAATPGANENAGEDVSRVKGRVMRIIERCGCAVVVVHHKPAGGGRPRGHGSLTGDFETTIDIDWLTRGEGREVVQVRDDNGRPIRFAKVTKQREGEQGLTWRFVLRQVVLGQDHDGDNITSCVTEPPAETEATSTKDQLSGAKGPRRTVDGRWYLRPNLEMAMRALQEAITRYGRVPDGDDVRAPDGAKCVTVTEWRDEWMRLAKTEDDPETLKERVKKARDRAVEKLMPAEFIGKDEEWVWRTWKRIFNVDQAEQVRSPPPDDEQRDNLPDDLPF